MSSSKITRKWGVLVAMEASYGSGGTGNPSTDGFLHQGEEPIIDTSFLHDGARRLSGGHGGRLKRVKRSGRAGSLTLTHEPHGAGAAYSASALPSADRLLRASGYKQTLDTTPGSENVTYDPITDPGDWESVFIESYTRLVDDAGTTKAEKEVLDGAYSNFRLSADGPEIPVAEFPVIGRHTRSVDVAFPTITYPSVAPPKAINVQFAIGAFTAAVVRRFAFDLGRADPSPRADDNASGGHAGFTPNDRNPTLEVALEQTLLSTADPPLEASKIDLEELLEEDDFFAISLQIGSTQYNRYKLTAPAASVADVDKEGDGPTGLWVVTFEFHNSAAGAEDDHKWTWD